LEFAFLREQHDRRGEDRLADGCDLIDRLRLGRRAGFDVRQAVPGGLDEPSVLNHGQRKARDPPVFHLGEEIIVCLVGP
jgi:hypothetical protein